jgi:hypothetical protein
MRNPFGEALARLWTSLRRRRAPVAARKVEEQAGGGRVAARARFWAEFREGQREAEALRAKVRP